MRFVLYILLILSGISCSKFSIDYNGENSVEHINSRTSLLCTTPLAPKKSIPTYVGQIGKLIESECLGCHAVQEPRIASFEGMQGGGGFQSLNAIKSNFMPPIDSGHSLSEEEKDAFEKWVNAGMPKSESDCDQALNNYFAPTCEVSLSKSRIFVGESIDIEIKTQGIVENLNFNQESIVFPTQYNTTYSPTQTEKLIATVQGFGQESVCEAMIVVDSAPKQEDIDSPGTPTCSLTSNPNSVEEGSSAEITFLTEGEVTQATIDGTQVEVDGSVFSQVINSTTTINGKVEGPGGSSSCKVTINAIPKGITENEIAKGHMRTMINEARCAFCHLKIIGDMGTTRENRIKFYESWNTEITGNWYSSEGINLKPQKGIPVIVHGEAIENYNGLGLPKDTNQDGKADFPEIDFTNAKSMASGTVSTENIDIVKISNQNTVLNGTDSTPIAINGDVFINGDLIILGKYKGNGTIYVNGKIYIPSNLEALNSPFPFSENKTQALNEAIQAIKENKDGLALLSNDTIHIGDFTKRIYDSYSTFQDASVLEGWRASKLQVNRVFAWYPDYKKDFYREVKNCNYTGQRLENNWGSFELVESFLYARKAITGMARNTSYSIRGGVITDYYHIQSRARDCSSSEISIKHGRPMNRSYIEFDYRLNTGLSQRAIELQNTFKP